MTPSGPLPVSRDVRDRDTRHGELTELTEPTIIFYNEKFGLNSQFFAPIGTAGVIQILLFLIKIFIILSKKGKKFSIISSRKPSKKSKIFRARRCRAFYPPIKLVLAPYSFSPPPHPEKFFLDTALRTEGRDNLLCCDLRDFCLSRPPTPRWKSRRRVWSKNMSFHLISVKFLIHNFNSDQIFRLYRASAFRI